MPTRFLDLFVLCLNKIKVLIFCFWAMAFALFFFSLLFDIFYMTLGFSKNDRTVPNFSAVYSLRGVMSHWQLDDWIKSCTLKISIPNIFFIALFSIRIVTIKNDLAIYVWISVSAKNLCINTYLFCLGSV